MAKSRGLKKGENRSHTKAVFAFINKNDSY